MNVFRQLTFQLKSVLKENPHFRSIHDNLIALIKSMSYILAHFI